MAARISPLAAGLVLSTTILTAVQAAEHKETSAPITDIRLSSGGLAEIRRQAAVSGDSRVTLTVPFNQVDDVLKSLVVSDPKGNIGSVSLVGKQPLTEVFKSLPFLPSDLASRPSLLNALQGASVTVSGNGSTTKGRLTGIETITEASKDGGTTTRRQLNLVSNGKIVSFDLDKVDVSLDDPALQAKVNSGLDAVMASKASDSRDIAIEVKGSGPHDISVGYVVPAPIWKASYRLNLAKTGDKANIQGWAIVENNSSDDWKDVRLSLSSGSPVTLYQRLYESYYAQRPEIPVYGPSGIVPLADTGGEIAFAKDADKKKDGTVAMLRVVTDPEWQHPAVREATAKQQSLSAASAIENGRGRRLDTVDSRELAEAMHAIRPAPAAPPPPPSIAEEADISTLFTLQSPINLPRGQSLTVPFTNDEMTVSRVSVFQPQLRINNPVAGILLKNQSDTSLPPGILTMFDDGVGYVGDAQLAGLPAGESRLLTFATDRKVQVTSTAEKKDQITSVIFTEGTLRVSGTIQHITTYTVKGASDADRTIIIEHPRRTNLTYSGEFNDSQTPTAVRIKLDVPKGKIGKATIIGEQKTTGSFAASTIEENFPMQGMWTSQVPDNPALRDKLDDISKAVEAVKEKTQALTTYDEEVKRIVEDQQRIRDNLKAVPAQSDLAKNYLSTLTKQEQRLGEIASLRNKAEDDLKAARDIVAQKLKSF